MSITQRDREALDVVASRAFGNSYLASLEFDMQVRRLTLSLYGPLQGGHSTYLGRLTFFGAAGFGADNVAGSFPESVRVATLTLSYANEDDAGTAELRGTQPWTLFWSFDGLAYEEHAAVLASLADEV
jgi:hypothetical protein